VKAIRPFLSFIIPVYNAEKYLPACLESVVNQTLKSIEIIIIDDGSTDNSPCIIKQYAEQDSRIRVIRQAHGGVSQARNRGIYCASGYYTWFIDADDWVELNSAEFLQRAIDGDGYDVILFSWTCVNEDGSIFRNIPPMFENKFRFNPNNRYEIFANIINGKLCTIWRGIYSTDLIKNQLIYFDETMRNSEDELYSYEILVKCQDGIFVDHYLYYHRNTPSSLTHTFHPDEFINSLRARTLAWNGKDSQLSDSQLTHKYVMRNTRSSINYIMRLGHRYGESYKKERFAALENILHYSYLQDLVWKASYNELGVLYRIQLWLARKKMVRTIWVLNNILFSRLAMKVTRLIGIRWVKSINET